MKVCKKCCVEKKIEEFPKTIINGKIYYRGECVVCFRIKNNKSQRESRKGVKIKKVRPIKKVKPKIDFNKDLVLLQRDKCFKWVEMVNGRSGWVDIKGLLIDLMEVYETLIGSVTYVEGEPHEQLEKMWIKVNQEYNKKEGRKRYE